MKDAARVISLPTGGAENSVDAHESRGLTLIRPCVSTTIQVDVPKLLVGNEVSKASHRGTVEVSVVRILSGGNHVEVTP